MRVGYVRVSSVEQNEERQIVALQKKKPTLRNSSSTNFLPKLLNALSSMR